jgi:Ser/Thr protein kinase RdoA (MazF antagonist)
MESSIAKLFDTNVLQQAVLQFGIDAGSEVLLGNFENYVYEVTREKKPYVLRFIHSSHRAREQVEAELDWILFLKKEGSEVAVPVMSAHGRLMECLTAAEGEFIVSLFEKAPGSSVRVDDDQHFQESLFVRWGEVIGHMHQATRSYDPRSGQPRRMDWKQEEMAAALKLAAKEPFLLEKVEKLLKQIRMLPVNKDVYGLIHTDIHSGNFFIDGNNMTVFDFDDCCYHWFINDLAIPLFYSSFYRYPKDEQQREGFARRFFSSFLTGYLRRYKLDGWWLEQIPLFLMFRDITFYSALRLKLSQEDMTPALEEMITEVKKRIEEERPVVHINYRHIFQQAMGGSL